MKKELLTSLILMGLACNVHAEEKCGDAVGNVIMGKVSLGCMRIAGTAKLDGTTLKGMLRVAGPLDAKSTHLTSLQIAGKTNLADSIITGPVHIAGPLEATNTTFQGTVKLSAKSAMFSHCTLKDIEITSDKAGQAALISLENGTTVTGNITFVNGNGVVKNSHSSIAGKVIGGKSE